MRQIDEAFAARLAAADTTICACWRLVRRDGATFGATDHDRPITFGGVTFAPAAGLETVTLSSTCDLSPGQAAASGALTLGFVSELDIARGLWDGARVDVWRVDWRAPQHRVMIWSGRITEIARRGAAFTAELVSLKASLEHTIGRIYQRTCDAEVGDARCGVDLVAPAFRAEGGVTSVHGPQAFTASALAAFASGWFDGGRLTWTTGGNAGSTAIVMRHAGDGIELFAPPRVSPQPGDGFVATAGCDKSAAMCRNRFGNLPNFRGFPHMPGPDAVLAGPSSMAANAGGRRG